MAAMSYGAAALSALSDAMEADPSIWCVGEDLGRGGVFGQYKGLRERFGEARVSDAPISEAAIMGVAFGAAMVGTRPVVEMRFADFALCATDELINQVAKARFMFGGQSRAPMVIRKPMGMWRSSAAQHSQSLESWYAHVPGLVVAVPSTPQDNHSLMRASLEADDPVVYLEHKNIWAEEGEVDPGEPYVWGTARTRHEGDDVTIVAWSDAANRAEAAARDLAAEGIGAHVLDLRTLWPWDRDAVCESAARTGRLLVAHESVAVGGFGAEVVASTVQEVSLSAPPRRLGSPRSLIPYAPNLEDRLRVTQTMIADAAREMCR